jgi:hypothetical protein
MEKKMFKIGGFLLLAIFVFASCLSAPTSQIFIDDNIPHENTAIVMVSSQIEIKKFNDIDVESEWYPRGRRRNLRLTVPAGETNFIYDMYWPITSGQVNRWLEGKDLSFSFNFEAGNEYTVGFYEKSISTSFKRMFELYLAVWDRVFLNAQPDRSHENNIIQQWLVRTFSR